MTDRRWANAGRQAIRLNRQPNGQIRKQRVRSPNTKVDNFMTTQIK